MTRTEFLVFLFRLALIAAFWVAVGLVISWGF